MKKVKSWLSVAEEKAKAKLDMPARIAIAPQPSR